MSSISERLRRTRRQRRMNQEQLVRLADGILFHHGTKYEIDFTEDTK